MMFITIGGILFWVILAAWLVATEVSVAWDSQLGWIWSALLLVGLTIFSPFNPFVWALANVLTIVFAFGVYVVVGASWGFIKWIFYVKDQKDKIGDLQSYRDKYNQGTDASVKGYSSFLAYLQSRGMAPKATKEKLRISVWMCWWPFSMFESVFNDVLRRMWNWIIETYIQTFDNITARIFK